MDTNTERTNSSARLIKYSEEYVNCHPLTHFPHRSPAAVYREYGGLLYRSSARAGILPYCYEDGSYYFLLGRDGGHGELSDFSGGPDRQDRNLLTTAVREYNQESGQCAGSMDDIFDRPRTTYYLQVKSYFMILAKCKYSRSETLRIFRDYHPNNPEIEAVYWISLDELQRIVNRDHPHFDLYLPTRIILSQGLTQWLSTQQE